MKMQRSAGILLPISSLPSPYGIGCFSQEAYDFVDWLKEAGQTYWQILPLGVTSYGDSPYQSFSAFAGNPYFISLDALVEEGVLTAAECKKANFGRKADDIDYSRLYAERGRLLRLAFAGGALHRGRRGRAGGRAAAPGQKCGAQCKRQQKANGLFHQETPLFCAPKGAPCRNNFNIL